MSGKNDVITTTKMKNGVRLPAFSMVGGALRPCTARTKPGRAVSPDAGGGLSGKAGYPRMAVGHFRPRLPSWSIQHQE